MSAEIDDVVPLARQIGAELLFQFKAGMIGGESDSHGLTEYNGRIPIYVVK